MMGALYMDNKAVVKVDSKNWAKSSLISKIKELALRRKLKDLTIVPVLTIITEYKQDQLPIVLDALERMHAHLTAAVVSNDPLFMQKVIGKTVNGTTYAGLRARTTGAPQNHWFGPAGDPRGAGIWTPEAIRLVWSCHREIIYDVGPLPKNWEIPPST
ncbi:delta-1-pyrroline-5-carboxylate dehydrogenase 12A1, mitochondrial-like [Macadamia integrifolia]|uniref:delta-1-pyrroline-5-carboxylate dehydrogenase 12A1, mitochondrial-like n=1 Tax=Macadamia integrifolia TaxID=60698 RepID=UPI001C52C095|nr:delta-1-pyrroline-5-carboxylate dehydrogenase 12A1, mitochondrial-like [Macadamia integrifolia]XP_042478606.1 delta-1-pyrroline-5-carboxylate dehydrogenase 12A1, mitochondrial-like [Macadamia integrifolia]